MPASNAKTAMVSINAPIGRSRRDAWNLGSAPARHANAAGTPKISPIHQDAMTPHPKASSVGESVSNTGGWPIVKYSTHTRAVT